MIIGLELQYKYKQLISKMPWTITGKKWTLKALSLIDKYILSTLISTLVQLVQAAEFLKEH